MQALNTRLSLSFLYCKYGTAYREQKKKRVFARRSTIFPSESNTSHELVTLSSGIKRINIVKKI